MRAHEFRQFTLAGHSSYTNEAGVSVGIILEICKSEPAADLMGQPRRAKERGLQAASTRRTLGIR
jgi:hypothetical protein